MYESFAVRAFVLLFSFSFFSVRLSLTNKNGNNDTKSLTARVSYMGLGPLNSGLYRN